jgi:rod shape-determining protein MreC
VFETVISRRRLLIGLILTAVLLVTLDLRGNPVISNLRSATTTVIDPLRAGADAAVEPLRRAWRGMWEFDDLEAENARLLAEIERQRGAAIAAEASVREAQELLALNGMQTLAGLESVTARVVGLSPSNWSQTVEIDQGRRRGIRVGMPVVNAAGLVGKVTRVSEDRSVIMLVSDPEFALAVKIINPVDSDSLMDVPGVKSGLTTGPRDPLAPVLEESVPVPVESAVSPTISAESGVAGPSDSLVASDTNETSSLDTTVSATNEVASSVLRAGLLPNDTGALEGRGPDRDPMVSLVEANPRLGGIEVGAVVMTAGGVTSLAPPDVVVGRVATVTERPGSVGPMVTVALSADLGALNFVRVLLYRPGSGG